MKRLYFVLDHLLCILSCSHPKLRAYFDSFVQPVKNFIAEFLLNLRDKILVVGDGEAAMDL